MNSTTASTLTAVTALPLRLAPGEVHRLAGPLHVVRLAVRAGRVWVTQPGDPHDHFLGPGDELTLCGRGPVVLESDGAEPAELRVMRPVVAWRVAWGRLGEACRAALVNVRNLVTLRILRTVRAVQFVTLRPGRRSH